MTLSDLNLRRSRGTLGDPVQVRGEVAITGIEDGKVGIANTTSSLEVDVIQRSSNKFLAIIDYNDLLKTSINDFSSSVILAGSSAIFSTETVTAGRKFVVENINVSGDEDAKFALRVNGIQVAEFKNSGAMPSQSFILKGVEPVAGDVVDIVVTSCADAGSSANFATGMNGYTIPTS